MVIVFDVNGTLTDLRALEPRFRRMFGARYPVEQWFAEVIQYAMAVTASGGFVALGEIAGAVLEMAAAAYGVRLSRTEIREVRESMQSLPPYPEVRGALERLRRDGFRLAVLTNSAPSAMRAQLRHAGLDGCFERMLSVAEVKRYKPDPATYRYAARAMGVATRDILMTAAHPWDLMGAARAGCRTALVRRPGTAEFPAGPRPDLAVSDLEELAERLAGAPVRTRTPAPLVTLAAAGAAAALLWWAGRKADARDTATLSPCVSS